MAKRKHPTVQSIRQGQTVYWVNLGHFQYPPKPFVEQLMIGSYRTPIPPPAVMIETVIHPQIIKDFMAIPYMTNKHLFYSRRRAESYIKRLKARPRLRKMR